MDRKYSTLIPFMVSIASDVGFLVVLAASPLAWRRIASFEVNRDAAGPWRLRAECGVDRVTVNEAYGSRGDKR